MSDQILEKYNLNHHSAQPSGDEMIDWIYANTQSDAPESSTDMAWDKLSGKIANPSKGSNYQFLKIAAAILLLAVSVFIVKDQFSEPTFSEFSAIDGRKSLKLPDGSTVIMNQGASISYSDDFLGNREITLKGQAYFDVVKNDNQFQVIAEKVTVQVLGTAFDVDASSSNVSVIVDRGLVAVSTDDNKVELTVNEAAVFNANAGTLTKLQEAVPNAMSWRTGKFEFNDTELSAALQDLGKFYNVEFVLEENLKSCKVTASFDNEPLKKVVQVLETILDVKISRNQSKLLVKGKGC